MASVLPPMIASVKVIEAVGKHTGTVIFLHGLGDQGTSFIPLANLLQKQHPHLKFILPSAKDVPITLNSGYRMPAWFDIPSLSNLTSSLSDDEPRLLSSCSSIDSLIASELSANPSLTSERIVLGGFSQGSVISLLTGIMTERKLGGVVALSGWVPLSHKIAELAKPNVKNLALFWGHGTHDEVVRFKFGEMSLQLIQSLPQIQLPLVPEGKTYAKPGVVFKAYRGVGHSLCAEEIDDLSAWLKEAVPQEGSS